MADWGFPFNGTDIRWFIKNYMDKKGVSNSRFKENKPTSRFIYRFLERHPDLKLRKTNPIKRSRAAVSREDVQEFFTHFKVSAEGVPPENMFNYDETNLRDDPGAKKCLFRNGTKYCEKVQNTSKQATSVMFCGSAAGEMLPPMVVYKAMNIYTSWCERGPKGTIYSCSKSGWFDGYQFEKWFFELLLPRLKRKVGKKLIIGDNLSSHISMDVVQACRENDIAFVCLPANSTDKLQPLDVGVFGPMKSSWRKILTEYKEDNPTKVGILKIHFPGLLLELLQDCEPGRHLPAAFKKCGLFPVDEDQAIMRIPSRDMETEDGNMRDLLDSSLLEKLEKLRGVGGKEKKKPRGKKIKIPAGKSYCAVRDEENEENIMEEEIGKQQKKKKITKRITFLDSDSESEVDSVDNAEDDDDPDQLHHSEEDLDEDDPDDGDYSIPTNPYQVSQLFNITIKGHHC